MSTISQPFDYEIFNINDKVPPEERQHTYLRIDTLYLSQDNLSLLYEKVDEKLASIHKPLLEKKEYVACSKLPDHTGEGVKVGIFLRIAKKRDTTAHG